MLIWPPWKLYKPVDFCEVHVSRIVLRNIHTIAHNLPQMLANHFIIPTDQYGEQASECTIAGSLSMAMKATPSRCYCSALKRNRHPWTWGHGGLLHVVIIFSYVLISAAIWDNFTLWMLSVFWCATVFYSHDLVFWGSIFSASCLIVGVVQLSLKRENFRSYIGAYFPELTDNRWKERTHLLVCLSIYPNGLHIFTMYGPGICFFDDFFCPIVWISQQWVIEKIYTGYLEEYLK